MQSIPFGRYRLMALLGQRGLGELWRAYDTATERVVALTLLPAHLSQDSGFQERFRREAHAAAELNNPHLVPIHNFGEIESRLYVDMRLIEGRELQTVLADGPLAAERAVRLVMQICTAVDAVHRAGLVHGDVKPSNVLVADRDFVYLIDFGIARTVVHTETTVSGFATATLPYPAPERLSTGQADPRSDIYALTCVLQECLTGRQLAAGHLTAPPPRPSAIRPGVPLAFDTVIAKGLAENPAERYDTALQLADAAHAALRLVPPLGFHSAPTQQRSPEARRWADDRTLPTHPWWRRKAVAIAAVAAVAVIVAASVVAVSVGDRPGPADSASPSLPLLKGSVFERALLSAADVSSVVGEPDLKVTSSLGAGPGNWPDHLGNVDNWACVGALYLAERAVYAGTGAGGGDIRRLDSPGDQRNHHVEESAVVFDTVDNARSVFDKSLDQWMNCNNTQVTTTSRDGSEGVWMNGSIQVAGGSIITQSQQQLNTTGGWGCQHAMGQVSNMVAEAFACGIHISDQGKTIVSRIMRNATGQ